MGTTADVTTMPVMTPATCRVLLVEDNAESLSGLFALLSDIGFSVCPTSNGGEAVDLLTQGARPNVILLDLMMPKVTGWEVLKHLRSDPELRDIPVIVMTALDLDEARVVGADLVLHKPIQPGELIDAVQRLSGTRSAN